MIVANELYDGKPGVDLVEEELIQGLGTSAGDDVQQTSDEEFCWQIFRGPNMNASVPVTAGNSCKSVPCGNTLLTAYPQRR